MSEINLDTILKIAVAEHASDVHLKAGLPPILRIFGNLQPIKNYDRITPEDTLKIASSMMRPDHKEDFKKHRQVDMAYSIAGLSRFRVNIFQQRSAVGIVLRVIPASIKTFEDLHLPKVLMKLCEEMRGLILVTGITGSGKSTTLATMVDHINSTRSCHIISVEDPIEYVHKDRLSIINQREIGVDAESFAVALRGALRQDPDVILVGEMRDLETIDIALTAAETGHLVLSTLHTVDAVETINRIVAVFPPHQQKQIRIQLAGVLRGVVSQRLIPTIDGNDRVPAVEVLISNSRVKSCIEDKDKTKEITDAIYKGHTTYGMQTFDQSIMNLYETRLISYEEALRQASNPDDFALRVKGVTSTTDVGWEEFGDHEKGAKGDDKAKRDSKDDGIERF